MKLSETQVRYVAELAHLELSQAEVARMAHELSAILEYVEKLNAIDTTAVEPMAQVLYDAEETATLRADVPGATLDNATALANAPLAGAGHFKVPKVIER